MNKLIEAQRIKFRNNRKALAILNAKPTDLLELDTKFIDEVPDVEPVDWASPIASNFKFDQFYLSFELTEINKNTNEKNKITRTILVDLPKGTTTKKNFKTIVGKIMAQEVNAITYGFEQQDGESPQYKIKVPNLATITVINKRNPNNLKNLVLNKHTYNYGNIPIVVDSECVFEAVKNVWGNYKYDGPRGGVTPEQAVEIAKMAKRSIKFIDRFYNDVCSYKHNTKTPYATLVIVDHQHVELYSNNKYSENCYQSEEDFTNKFNQLIKTDIPFVTGWDHRKHFPKSYLHGGKKYIIDYFIKYRQNIPDNKNTLTYYFEDFVSKNPPMLSIFNKQVSVIFANLSWGPIIKTLQTTDETLHSIDLNGCYPNILEGKFDLLPKVFNIPIFDINCQVEPFTKTLSELPPGLYLTERGWVFHVTVKYYNLKPTHQIIASDYLPNTSIKFNTEIKCLKNAILGNMHKQAKFYNDTQIFTTQEEALRYDENIKQFQNFWISSRITVLDDTRNYRPVIGIILELYHILIDEMVKQFNKINLNVYEIRTDAFLVNGIPKPSFYKKFNCKYEGIKHIKNFQNVNKEIKTTYNTSTWNYYSESDIPDLIKSGKNFLVLGPAGTGKSTIIRTIDGLKLAYTNTAAENIGGKTIDSCLSNKFQQIPNTVVIDEITQVPLNLLKHFYSDKFNDKQLIGFGDNNQLGYMLSNDYVKRYNIKNTRQVDKLYGGDHDIRDFQYTIELFENLVMLTTVHRVKEPISLIPSELDNSYEAILCYSQDEVQRVNNKLFKGYLINSQVQHMKTHRRYKITRKRNCIELTPFNKNHDIIEITMEELIKNYEPSYAVTIYSSQGQEYFRYGVIDYENLEGKNKYVVDTRRRGPFIHTLKI